MENVNKLNEVCHCLGIVNSLLSTLFPFLSVCLDFVVVVSQTLLLNDILCPTLRINCSVYLLCSMLKNDYFQKGGHDPAILAQIRDLEFEAQRVQAVQRPAPPPGKEHSLAGNGVCNFYYMHTVYIRVVVTFRPSLTSMV